MIGQFKSKQFLLFLITGGFAASINFLSRILYSNWLGFSSAVILAYITGMVTAFLLAKIFVFKQSQQSLHHSVLYFGLVNLVAIGQTWAISMGLNYYVFPAIGIIKYSEDFSHALGVLAPVFTSYLGHKHFSFK